MADIKLRIEVNPNAETETLGTITNKIDSIGSNANLSNVSFKASDNGIYTNTSNPKESGREMLSWGENGVLSLKDGYLSNVDGTLPGMLASEVEPDEFVWGVVPASKKYSVTLTFSNANSLKDIIIYGDPTAKQFPTKAIVDGTKTIYSDDDRWAISMDTESDTHTIELTDWNRDNYNACLTKIMVMLRYFDVDKGWITSLECLAQSTSNPASIQYGTLGGSGSVQAIDANGELKDYLIDGIISNYNTPAELVINNNTIQSFKTYGGNDYDNNTKNTTISLSTYNTIQLDKTYNGMPLQASPKSLYWILSEVMKGLGFDDITSMTSSHMVYSDNVGDVTIKQYLESIMVAQPFINRDSYRNVINKICEIAQLYMCEDKNGTPIFYSARPIATKEEQQTAIKIPKYMMASALTDSFFLDNKYTNVSIGETKLTEEWATLDSRKITSYTPDGFNISIANYKHVIDNNSFNPNITVAGSSLNIEGQGSGEQWIYDVIYYTIALPEDENLWLENFQANTQYTQYSSSGEANLGGSISDAFILKYKETTETQVLNNIINYDTSGSPISIKSSSINNWVQVLLNNNYATLFVVLPTHLMSGGTVLAMNNVINFGFQYKKYTVSETDINADSDFEISNNELLQSKTTIMGQPISTIIKENILSDYENGINHANIDLFCGDMRTTSNIKAKDWASGQIIDVKDIVAIDGDTYSDGSQRLWRITGRTFQYSGSPRLKLELQEVKQLAEPIRYTITIPSLADSSMSIKVVDLFGVEYHNGDTISKGNIITISVTGKNDYNTIIWLKANGEKIDDKGTQLQVNSDIIINVYARYVKDASLIFTPVNKLIVKYNASGRSLAKGWDGCEAEVGVYSDGSYTFQESTMFNNLSYNSGFYQTGEYNDGNISFFVRISDTNLTVDEVQGVVDPTKLVVKYFYNEYINS